MVGCWAGGALFRIASGGGTLLDWALWALLGVAGANLVLVSLNLAATLRLIGAARRVRPDLVPAGPRGSFALLSTGELRTIVDADVHEHAFEVARSDYLATRRAQNLVGPTLLVLTVAFMVTAVLATLR
jgi:hypothetical protein